MLRLSFFFFTVSSVLCGSTFFILKRRLQLPPHGNLILGCGLFILFLMLFLGPLLYRSTNVNPAETWSYALQLSQYFLMGWVGVIFIVFGFLEVLQTITKVFDPGKRIFLTEGVSRGIFAGVTIATGTGLFQAMRGPEINPVNLTIPTLPKEFNGLKIVQISDVHIGPLLHRSFLESVVEKVLSLNADMIFITGDLVDGTIQQLSEHVEPLKKLKAKDGVYFCTGNHEYYSGANEWIALLESFGIHVFKNSNVILTRGKSKILVGGVFDFQARRFDDTHTHDPHLAAQTTEPIATKLLLAHNPYSIDSAVAAGFDVQFSGHTHAGQFYPFALITKLVLKYFEGLYQINEKTQLYVNRGTGYWGPPNRLGKTAEITHFTLIS